MYVASLEMSTVNAVHGRLWQVASIERVALLRVT